MREKTGPSPTELRRRAEERLQALTTADRDLSTEDARSLLHELRVHQVELEMQNEELIRAQAELRTYREDLELFNIIKFCIIWDRDDFKHSLKWLIILIFNDTWFFNKKSPALKDRALSCQ